MSKSKSNSVGFYANLSPETVTEIKRRTTDDRKQNAVVNDAIAATKNIYDVAPSPATQVAIGVPVTSPKRVKKLTLKKLKKAASIMRKGSTGALDLKLAPHAAAILTKPGKVVMPKKSRITKIKKAAKKAKKASK